MWAKEVIDNLNLKNYGFKIKQAQSQKNLLRAFLNIETW